MTDPDERSELGQRAARSFLWALAGFGITQLGSFVTAGIAARVLGPSQYGVAATAVVVVFWLDILLDLGMGASLIYEQEQGQSERVRVAFTVNATVAVLLAATIFVGAPAIDRFFDAGNPTLFRIVALLVLFKGLNQIPDALLKRDLDFRRRSVADLGRATMRVAVALVLLAAGVGAISLVIAAAVGEAVAMAVTWWLVRFRPGLRFDGAVAAEMLRFGLAVFGARLVGMLWLNGDYLVLGARLGSRSPEYANYFQAFRLPELVLGSVYNLFANVAFPAFSAARTEGPERLRAASLKALRMLCLFGFPAGVGMSLIARDFIHLYVGDRYAGAVRPMEVLCVAGAFVAVGFASGDLYAAIGKPRLGLWFGLIWTPILIGGFLAVVDRGIVAVATVHLAVILPYAAFRIEVANRLIGTTWRQSLGALRPAFAASVGIVAVALPVRLATSVGVGSLAAIVAAGVVGAVVGLAVADRATLGELVGQGRGVLARIR